QLSLVGKNFIQQRIVRGLPGTLPQRQYLHAQRPRSPGDSMPYIAVADNSHSRSLDRLHIELIPHTGFLGAHHPPEILREENCSADDEFAQRLAEDSTAIGQR